MKTLPPLLALLLIATAGASRAGAADAFDDAVKNVAADYDRQLRQAAQDLERTRERLVKEKAPLLQARQAAEEHVLTLERETQRLETQELNATERRRKLLKDQDAVRKTITYLNSTARDTLKGFEDGLAPGENQLLTEPLRTLQQSLDTGGGNSALPAAEVLETLTQWTRHAIGGYTAAGQAVPAGSNQVAQGTLAFLGPDSYFLPDQGGGPSVLRRQPGATLAVGFPVNGWDRAAAEPFFRGQPGAVMVDASHDKALRLQETRGNVWSHIRAGGIMAYVILTTGALALLLIAQKIRDLAQMRLDPPAAVQGLLALVARGAYAEAERKLASLKNTTRELLGVALRHHALPKALLEEHLQACLHRQQTYFERRLSLLAVIATAAPLMGLLGTVSGMVNTFALMTVFGTGNAMKLSAGISEVLVATELGLIVAIPSLVVHGFLAHRIRKNLSLLEDYAMEFVIALDTARLRGGEPELAGHEDAR